MSITVIGGGITGLAAAHALVGMGMGDRTVLLEGRDRLGGTILTERHEGFILDGGPDSFLARKREGIDLCKDLSLGDQILPAAEIPDRVRILRGGRLEILPDTFLLGIPGDMGSLIRTRLLTVPGKLRLAMEPFISPPADEKEESVASFWTRRMGKEAYARIGEPLLGGIHASDTEVLSLHATFPELAAMERKHGSLTRAMRNRPRPSGKKPAGFVSLRGGMGDLVDALSSSLESIDVRTGSSVLEIRGETPPYEMVMETGESLRTDGIILAAPAHAASRMFAASHPDLSTALAAIPYVSTSVVFLAYPRSDCPDLPDGYGFLVPRTEGRKIIGSTFVSRKFPGRSPDDQVLIRVFVGGALNEDLATLPEEDLQALVIDEIREIIGISAIPSWTRTYIWEKSMPQYNLGHRERVAAIEKPPGIHLAGAAYHGSGIPDCIRQGREAARSVALTSPGA